MAVLSLMIFRLSISVVVVFAATVLAPKHASALTRHDFPDGFVLGAGTSAYQVLVSSTWLILHRPRISIS
jgi:hypothetical protein